DLKVLLSLGASYYFQGLLAEAIMHYDAALAAYERTDERAAQAYALNNLGIIYRIRRDHAKAVRAYERSLALKRAEDDTLGVATTLYNLGLAHAYQGHAEVAVARFAEARTLFRQLGEHDEALRTDVSEGVALFAMGRHDAARPLLERWPHLPERHLVERASAVLCLGEDDLARGRIAGGLRRLHQAEAYVAGSGRLDLQRQVARALAHGYDGIGDATRAAPHWKAYAMLGDTLAGEQRQWAIEEMRARYESREKDMVIRAQEEALELEAAQRRHTFAIAVLLGALLVSAALYARSRVRLNRRLRAAVEGREWLLREMHHRVKNNLQMLNSLISMQSRAVADPAGRAALQQSRARVHAIGLIHRFLYGRDAFRSIRMRPYLAELLEQIAQAADLDRRRVRLTAEVDDIPLDVDLATPLGLIVNELVTNAVKHAFPGERTGTVQVVLRDAGGSLELIVRDDGKGTTDDGHHGFGHTLVRTMAQRLNAELDMGAGPGTTVRAIIPLSGHGKEPAHLGGGG
ncbi:MAG: histidine kinase dimerization/phosphoacceptor domain -containing protein, partial [Flavobacteriales bacterium]|nr:histidine kinase dimerization/phosphoacceptor domain -containing protein [Flavobacteriales bacterium]